MKQNNINTSELECVLNDLLVKYKNKISDRKSWNGLSSAIEAQTQNNHHIDRNKLTNIGERLRPEKQLSLSIADLKALYEVFDEEDRKILAPLFSPRARLLSIFDIEEKMELFLAAVGSTAHQALMINRYHVRALEEILDSESLQHLKIKFIDVIHRKDARPENVRALKWYKDLHSQGKSVYCTIGQPYVNISTEYLLAKVFDQKPFQPDYEQRLPLRLFFPEQERKGSLPSCLDMTPDMFEDYCPDVHTRENRVFIVGNQPFISDRREELPEKEQITTYGLFILRYCASKDPKVPHILYTSIMGAYAPDNLAIAYRMLSGLYQTPTKLPKLKEFNQEPHVLILVIKNTIGQHNKALEEIRKITRIEVVMSQLWHLHRDKWKLKESSANIQADYKFTGELKGIEKSVELELY